MLKLPFNLERIERTSAGRTGETPWDLGKSLGEREHAEILLRPDSPTEKPSVFTVKPSKEFFPINGFHAAVRSILINPSRSTSDPCPAVEVIPDLEEAFRVMQETKKHGFDPQPLGEPTLLSVIDKERFSRQGHFQQHIIRRPEGALEQWIQFINGIMHGLTKEHTQSNTWNIGKKIAQQSASIQFRRDDPFTAYLGAHNYHGIYVGVYPDSLLHAIETVRITANENTASELHGLVTEVLKLGCKTEKKGETILIRRPSMGRLEGNFGLEDKWGILMTGLINQLTRKETKNRELQAKT